MRSLGRWRRAVTPLRGEVTVPGDKSISHRAVILGGLGRGRSRIQGVNLGEDVVASMRAMSMLGAAYTWRRNNPEVEVQGDGWGGLHEPDDVLDSGNSGTTLRALLGVCSAVPGATVLTGDATLRARPMLRVVSPLRRMGAVIDGRRGGDLAPLMVRGGPLRGIELKMDVASAQVKTAVLLAGLRAEGRTVLVQPAPSRDHTERMLAAGGAPIGLCGLTITVEGGQELAASDRRVPGDPSAAAFLLVAAAVVRGSELAVAGMGLNPTRTGFLGVLEDMGARLEIEPSSDESGEPVGTVSTRSSDLRGTTIEGLKVPAVIDEIPVLAVAATQAEGQTVIRDAAELRIKESDRISSMAQGLRSLGARIEELPDGLVIDGPTPLKGGEVDSRGDHRVAMAFAVAGLIAAEEVRIRGWDCVKTSFPEFVDTLGRARGN
jgi:3-phosphoshikimate 1-carboxyvinyltransferase